MVRSGLRGTPYIDLYPGVSRVYLLIAEETGLIGLGSFLLMSVFLACGWRAWRRMEKDSVLKPVLLGLAGALVGGLVDHHFFNFDFPQRFKFLARLCSTAKREIVSVQGVV